MRDWGHGIAAIRHRHAIDTVRKEEPSDRVHQPPHAVDFLSTEVPGRLELRAGGPSAPGVAILGRPFGIGGEPCRLPLLGLLKLSLVMDFSRPIVVDELAEAVDERQEGIGLKKGQRHFVHFGPEDREMRRRFRRVEEDM